MLHVFGLKKHTRAAIATAVGLLALCGPLLPATAYAADEDSLGDYAGAPDGTPPDQASQFGLKPFTMKGDWVHYSSNPPGPALSAHGWWTIANGASLRAKVTIQLQQHWGGWVTVDTGTATVSPGGGAGNRATARAVCTKYAGRTYTYRSVIDVDVLGYADAPNKLYTTSRNFDCSVLGKSR